MSSHEKAFLVYGLLATAFWVVMLTVALARAERRIERLEKASAKPAPRSPSR
jgi:hypothetical protein